VPLPSRSELSPAGQAIRDLQDAGLTQREIAAAIGRDSSYVSQINRGVTPGNVLAPALRDLADGRVAQPPPHRAGAAVPTAVVRTPTGGVVVNVDAATGARRTIANVARRRSGVGRVRIVADGVDSRGRPVRSEPWKRGGIRADELRRLVDEQLRAQGVDPSRASGADVSEALSAVIADASTNARGSDLEGLVVQTYSVEVL